jgi:hypothetical protein
MAGQGDSSHTRPADERVWASANKSLESGYHALLNQYTSYQRAHRQEPGAIQKYINTLTGKLKEEGWLTELAVEMVSEEERKLNQSPNTPISPQLLDDIAGNPNNPDPLKAALVQELKSHIKEIKPGNQNGDAPDINLHDLDRYLDERDPFARARKAGLELINTRESNGSLIDRVLASTGKDSTNKQTGLTLNDFQKFLTENPKLSPEESESLRFIIDNWDSSVFFLASRRDGETLVSKQSISEGIKRLTFPNHK